MRLLRCLRITLPSLTVIPGLFSFALAAVGYDDGDIIGERPYSFPKYEDAHGYTRADGTQDSLQKYWTKEEYESAVENENFEFKKLLYSSDDLTVVAYVYKPKSPKQSLPTLIFNRGSGVHKDIAPVLVPYFHRMAREGYVVVAPMYRETDNGEGQDGNGGEDLNDLLNILPVIQELPFADADNIFMTGESRGAMMVFQAIREAFPMRAAAVWGGFTDLGALFEAEPEILEYAIANWPRFDASDPQSNIERRSAIYWADRFHTPILLMHGERDRSTPVNDTLNLARELQRFKRQYGLIIFADDNHVLSKSQLMRDQESIKWFRRFDKRADEKRIERFETTAEEAEIIDYGYALMYRSRYEDAIEIFKIATKRFSDSSNAHDSLGEAYLKNGNKRLAVKSYKKARALSTDADYRGRVDAFLSGLRKNN